MMVEPDLFEFESAALAAAKETHKSDSASAEEYRRDLGALIEHYERLTREARLVINRSDRIELEMNRLNRELQGSEQALKKQLDEINALQGRLSEQANRDPLTSLYNRRFFGSTLERELTRCNREKLPLSLILIDIDNFKLLNDTYGHQAGDEVLIRFATMLNGRARASDVACRYGGEEFMLLLPNMPQNIARERAEEFRAGFAAISFPFKEFHIQATVSAGIATYPGHGACAEELIRCADLALYRAKSEGRNRIVVFGTEG